MRFPGKGPCRTGEEGRPPGNYNNMVITGFGEPTGYYANGSYGNYLLVVPKSHLVVARMASSLNSPGINFGDFFDLVRELAAKAH